MKEKLLFSIFLCLSVTINSEQNLQTSNLNSTGFVEDIYKFRYRDSEEETHFSSERGKNYHLWPNMAKDHPRQLSEDLMNSVSREEEDNGTNSSIQWKSRNSKRHPNHKNEIRADIQKLVREYLENIVLSDYMAPKLQNDHKFLKNIMTKRRKHEIYDGNPDFEMKQMVHSRKKRQAYSPAPAQASQRASSQTSDKSTGQQSGSQQGQKYQQPASQQRYAPPSSSNGRTNTQQSQSYQPQTSGQQGRPSQQGQQQYQQDPRYRQQVQQGQQSPSQQSQRYGPPTSGQQTGTQQTQGQQRYRPSNSGQQPSSQQTQGQQTNSQQSQGSKPSSQQTQGQQTSSQQTSGQQSSSQQGQRYPSGSSQSGSTQYTNQRQPAQPYNQQQSWQQTQQSSQNQNPSGQLSYYPQRPINPNIPYQQQQGQQNPNQRYPQFPNNYNNQQNGGRPSYNPRLPGGNPSNGELGNGNPANQQQVNPTWGPQGPQAPPGPPGLPANPDGSLDLGNGQGGIGDEYDQMTLDDILQVPKYQEIIMDEAKQQLNNALAANMDLLAEEIVEGLEGDASAEIMHQLELRESSNGRAVRAEFYRLAGPLLLPLCLVLL